jgi:hypothetical protein
MWSYGERASVPELQALFGAFLRKTIRDYSWAEAGLPTSLVEDGLGLWETLDGWLGSQGSRNGLMRAETQRRAFLGAFRPAGFDSGAMREAEGRWD